MSLRRYNSHSASSAAEITTITVMLILTAVFAFFKTTQFELKITDVKFEFFDPPEGPVIIPVPRPTTPPRVFIPSGMDPVEETLAGDDPLVFVPEDFNKKPLPPIEFSGIKDIKDVDAIPFVLVQEKPLLSVSEKNKLVKTLTLNFPELARKSNTEGKVKLSFVCSAEGFPTNIEIISEKPKNMGFGEAAVRSLKTVRFTPGYQSDKAVAVRMSIPLNFSLTK